MSDRFDELARNFEENVLRSQHSRSIGLFTIPEYPEFEGGHGMWSTALDILLTTLRYLGPATLLTLFWGQPSFIFKFLKYIDCTFRAIVFSNEEQKQAVLKWLSEAGPAEVDELDAVWQNGWVVCAVLDAALPGACAGHTPTKLSLKHAQSIADHYLGVEPVFSRHELELNDSLSKHQEWRLAIYLDNIRMALAKLTPPVSRQISQKTSPDNTQFTFDYVARGSGLSAAQVNSKMHFKIYATAQQAMDPGEITILIRGPKDTYGMYVSPPVLGKAQLIRQNLLGLQANANFTENALPITHGATYLRSYGKNDMNKTYYIPKTKYDIDIDIDTREDHVRVGYIVQYEGEYEISITSRGQNIVGSPFTMRASTDIFSVLEKDSFSLEDGEEIDILDIKTDKKVVLRIVDFVTEKMLLKENGTLEKISDEEANQLMAIEIAELEGNSENNKELKFTMLDDNTKKFKALAFKIIKMLRICNKFNNLVKEKHKVLKLEKLFIDTFTKTRSQREIPDIVNSTFNDTGTNPFVLGENREKLIIPENISVAIRTEKSSSEVDKIKNNTEEDVINVVQSDVKLHKIYGTKDDNISKNTLSLNNPFLNNSDYETEKEFGSFVQTEYETNNSQNEEADVKSTLQVENYDELFHDNNPFYEPDLINLERPKTPIYKIITDNVKDRNDSVYFDSNIQPINDTCLDKDFNNPFYKEENIKFDKQEQISTFTDFIIGAPVSLPPTINATSPEPGMNSMIMITPNKESNSNLEVVEKIVKSDNNVLIVIEQENCSTEQSSDLNETHNSATFTLNDNQSESSQSDKTFTSRKELWDSAYVSIDDNTSSPDTNNNENTLNELATKQIYATKDGHFELKTEEIAKMGPAEREIWDFELNIEYNQISDDLKSNKSENKRSIFTPIIEENDKNLSLSIKESKNEHIEHDADPVSVAFSEIDNIYEEYFPESETTEKEKLEHNQYKEHTYEIESAYVDSASDTNTDVKRHTNEQEGMISEVQKNATESDSVSRILHEELGETNYIDQLTENTKFGDNKTNIVLEKKKYWDNRISEIEAARSEEMKAQKKRRLSSKHLRHNDSLSKRRGKKIVKNFLNAGGNHESEQLIPVNRLSISEWPKPEQTDIKLVEKWKKYWNEKVDVECEDVSTVSLRSKSPKIKENLLPQQDIHISNTSDTSINKETTDAPVTKQELCEEVFKAFETSPKRFFGTSRKQILNKLDSYLGKPTVEEFQETKHDTISENGLVSSRISLFLNKSKTEEFSKKPIKSKSMHNIYQRKNNENENATLNPVIHGCKDNKIEISDIIKHQNKDNESESRDESRDKNTKSVEDKRAIFKYKLYNTKSLDDTVHSEHAKENNQLNQHWSYSKQELNRSRYSDVHRNIPIIRKTSISKSEMDIFKKTTQNVLEENLDKHKSYEGLPKVNVKSFINLYESATKIPETPKLSRKASKDSLGSQNLTASSSKAGAANTLIGHHLLKSVEHRSMPHIHSRGRSTTPPKQYFNRHWAKSNAEIDNCQKSIETDTSIDSIDLEIMGIQDPTKETTYLSLSDIELEIIETKPEPEAPIQTPASNENLHEEYKSRFKMAKEYFKSLEELRETKNLSPKLNECEMMLYKSSPKESPKHSRPQKRVKKNIKYNSMPSSEISKIWEQLQNKDDKSENSKLTKISEKFNVEDLFNDIMEGRLSRQGSLRGIPNKKAVLETFRSMENVSVTNLNSYDISVSQLTDFAQENNIKNAQTYLTEYPYLPTTDPSKYHSRLDTRASGLVSMKELLDIRHRRNSVPDLRLITNFTVEL